MSDALNLMAAFGTLFEAAAEAMQEAVAETVFARSEELVPVDTSALKASGRVSDPSIAIGQATVIVSYGNPDDQTGIYAIVQHERTDLRHPNGGQAKYLEAALLEYAAGFAAEIATRMKG